MQQRLVPRSRHWWWLALGCILVFGCLYLASLSSYVLFHSIVEVFAIVISCAVFTLTWNTRRYLANDYLPFVGIALLAASALNLMHVLTYKGMGLLAGQTTDLPTQLWIARRYLESIALLCAPLFFVRKLAHRTTLVAFTAIVALLLASMFRHVFPAAYVDGAGLTPFKKASEYIIAVFFLLSAWLLYRNRARFAPDVSNALLWSLGVSALAELLFTLYVGVYDLPNLLGHYLTLVSYYLIYVAIVKTGLVRPYTLLSTANAALRAEIGERERAQAALKRQSGWLQSLHAIDQAILASQSPATIAHDIAVTLVQATSALQVEVILFDAQSDCGQVLAAHGAAPDLPRVGASLSSISETWLLAENRQGRMAVLPDVALLTESDALHVWALAAGIHSGVGFPLNIGGQAIGSLVLGYAGAGALPPDTLDFLGQTADQLAVAVHNARLFDEVISSRQQLRTLSHHLVALQEEERTNLSRELHDRAGQSMTALKLGLSLLRRENDCPPAVQAGLEEMRQRADVVMADLHQMAVSLRPASLDRFGLVPAIEQYVASLRQQTGVEVEFVAHGLDGERLPGDIETALYRVVQEALINVIRHAQAHRVEVVLVRRHDAISLVVEDDGIGFDAEEALRRGRLGLIGMRERAEMLGGSLHIESAPGAGATLYIEVPCT